MKHHETAPLVPSLNETAKYCHLTTTRVNIEVSLVSPDSPAVKAELFP